LQTLHSLGKGIVTQLLIERGITGLVFQDIARGALLPEIQVFLFALVSQAEQELNRSVKHCADFRKDMTDNLRRPLDFAGLQKHDIDSRLSDLPGGLEDLFLTQFKNRV